MEKHSFQNIHPHNPKKFWRAVKFLIKNHHTFPYLIDQEDGNEANGIVGKAGMLNFILHNDLTQGFPSIRKIFNLSIRVGWIPEI